MSVSSKSGRSRVRPYDRIAITKTPRDAAHLTDHHHRTHPKQSYCKNDIHNASQSSDHTQLAGNVHHGTFVRRTGVMEYRVRILARGAAHGHRVTSEISSNNPATP